MKRLLLLTTDYMPYPSSNTNCLEPLLTGLEADGWRIDIVTRRMREDSPKFETQANRQIWRVNDVRTIHTIDTNERLKKAHNGPLKYFYKIQAFFSKGLYYARYCLGSSEPRFAGWDKPAVLRKCTELLQREHFSVILSVSHPVITHVLAKQLKETICPNIPWILLEFDPYCFNEALYGKRAFKQLEQHQHILYQSCNVILTTPELYDLYQNTSFSQYTNKMYAIPLANLKQIEYDEESKYQPVSYESPKINCFFAGAVGKKIRDPRYAIRIFKAIGQNDIVFHMMTASRTNFFKKDLHSAKGAVSLWPAAPRNAALAAMRKADVLVNIGNSVSFQTPGKIFEYMAMGKPIIHFQKTENDPCLKYFKNYPLVLIIDEREGNVEKHAGMIVEFCMKNQKKRLEFKEVKLRLSEYLSENSVKTFKNIVDQLTSPNMP